MGIFKKACFGGVLLILTLSGFDAYEEHAEFTEIVFVGVAAIIAPLIAIYWAGFARKNYQPSLWRTIETAVVLMMGILGYGYYAFNGPSDPDTAGHMHVILFPITYVIFTIVLLAMSTGLSTLCKAR
jgi:hypothetical protein